MTVLRRNDSMNRGTVKPAAGSGGSGRGARPALPGPVVLIGLPGAGKTRVGKRLADRLGVGFADNDRAVVESAGMEITGIFEAYGETAFRDLEAQVLAGLLDGPARVVSTGGGAFMRPQTRALIEQKALSVWLKAAPATLAGRISNTDSRPLLRGRDAVEVLTGLAEERHPVYAAADLTVDTDGLELGAAADKLERELLGFLRRRGSGGAR